MGIVTLDDPASVVNAKARAEGWPFRCDSELVFDKAELNVLRDVWRAMAVKAGIPRHSDARALDSVLRRLTILERLVDADGNRRFFVRHQGTYLAAVMGNNEGTFIDERIPPELMPRWSTVFDAVLDSAVPLRVVVRFELQKLSYAAGEAFIAPLSDENGATTLLLTGVFIKPREDEGAATP